MFLPLTGKIGFSILLGALIFKIADTAPEAIEIYNSNIKKETSITALASENTEAEDTESQENEEVVLEQCEQTPEVVLSIITKERELLDLKENQAMDQLAEVDLAREKLSVERIMLQDLKGELEGLIAEIEAIHNEDVGRLIKLYSSMKPAEAAAIMSEMDIEVTVMVLGSMPETKAAPIIAKMDTIRAQAVSKVIYERSKLPGDQRLNGIQFN